MSRLEQIQNTIDNDDSWDNGELGRSEEHVVRSEFSQAIEDAINEATRMKPISIRLEESLIHDLKMVADHHNLNYQPMMRQLLKRFVDSEKKIIRQRTRAMEIQGPDSSDEHNTGRNRESESEPIQKHA